MIVRSVAASASLLAVMALAACDAQPNPDTGRTTEPSRLGQTTPTGQGPSTVGPFRCPTSAKLVPSCGRLWGISTQQHSVAALQDVEREVGRPFDLVYSYHDINDKIPTPVELQEARSGRLLHIAIAARIYGSSSPVTYAEIAAGDFDADLRREAVGIASIGAPVFVTFEQEANQQDKLGPRGTAAQFRSAWRHVHEVFDQAGARNAVWVWVMTGAPANLSRAGSLWPGNSFVDWISWNVYNQSGCNAGRTRAKLYQSFAANLEPFYHWVHTHGPALGIDPEKPMMLSEVGSVLYDNDPSRTAHWYAAIPAVLQRFPQIKAVALWDSHTTTCNYVFQRSPVVLRAVEAAGLSQVLSRL